MVGNQTLSSRSTTGIEGFLLVVLVAVDDDAERGLVVGSDVLLVAAGLV